MAQLPSMLPRRRLARRRRRWPDSTPNHHNRIGYMALYALCSFSWNNLLCFNFNLLCCFFGTWISTCNC
ncbi:hypothetical protein DAI22_03g125300 [Oryza sativa Japonica Group]|nr:hypothetical protein DAI22_03g125300 [Oryza sativa Japonica Group]